MIIININNIMIFHSRKFKLCLHNLGINKQVLWKGIWITPCLFAFKTFEYNYQVFLHPKYGRR